MNGKLTNPAYIHTVIVFGGGNGLGDEAIESGKASEDLQEEAFAGEAVATNRFVATIGPNGVRLAFLEENSIGSSYFRNAVVMSPQDGIRLYKMLQSMLTEIEARLHMVGGLESELEETQSPTDE